MTYYSAVFLISVTPTPVHREHGAQQQHIRYKKLGYYRQIVDSRCRSVIDRVTLDRGYFKVTEVKVVGLCGVSPVKDGSMLANGHLIAFDDLDHQVD